ncbi:hypothetical protein ABZT17_39555 [Streptomyces sp. NPDC005648]|uniref:Rv1733c family protein n=1 Tax=Streptomyces sp. NPDC005648 TaxID=3157044 RepID=UPI0033A1A74F
MSARPPRRPLWRWRRNPLRRHEDLVEAWIVLAVWVLVTLGGAVAGLVTGHAAADELARQRTERHPVRAVLAGDATGTATGGGGDDRVLARVSWTGSDGRTHGGRTLVPAGDRAGARVVVWLDGRGALTNEPTGPVEAGFEAALLGAAAALAVGCTAVGAGLTARWWLDRRRLDEWGREWERVGPHWSHRTP